MCGIAGVVDLARASTAADLEAEVEAMAATLVHRGPDDHDLWVDESRGIAFGFRRLAILDLSVRGRQPMASKSGRYRIVFNGETYNYRELRRELSGLGEGFRGDSDTEVLLAAIERWGLADTLPRLVGMFAFALWDEHARRLHLVRDRLGIKPLYYGRVGHRLLFASELRAIRAHPSHEGSVDLEALALFLRHNYVPAPRSIERGIHKLPPGTRVELDLEARELSPPIAWWSADEVFARGARAPFTGSLDEATDRVEELLRTAVADRLVADVPIGAFLSGGVDSTAVIATMQSLSSAPIRTFTIGFDDPAFDESAQARRVAEHLGTDHTELRVDRTHLSDALPTIARLHDEPFADYSQIPTFLVSRLARADVTVSLSGDGGDELFAGYTRYAYAERLWRWLRWCPRRVRAALAGLSRADAVSRPLLALGSVLPGVETLGRRHSPIDTLLKLLDRIDVDDVDQLYRTLTSHVIDPTSLVPGAEVSGAAHPDPPDGLDPTARMRRADVLGYLPDDILTKLDRASMAVSLEARVPLLDHRLVELAASLPSSLLQSDGITKRPLRRLVERRLAPGLLEHPKRGFGVPLAAWLRGDLRPWCEELLSESRLRAAGYVDATIVRRRWDEHLSGRRDWKFFLWNVLMFESWRAG